MFAKLKRLSIGLACVLVLCMSGAFAIGAAATTGSITGSVTGANGAAVTIKVFALHGKGAGKGVASTTERKRRLEPAGGATTDNTGAFTVPNLKDGEYVVIAVLKGVGTGHAKVDLTGASATANIALEPRKTHKKA